MSNFGRPNNYYPYLLGWTPVNQSPKKSVKLLEEWLCDKTDKRKFNKFEGFLPSILMLSDKLFLPISLIIPIPEYNRPLLIIGNQVMNQKVPELKPNILHLSFSPEDGSFRILETVRKNKRKAVSNQQQSPKRKKEHERCFYIGGPKTTAQFMVENDIQKSILYAKEINFKTSLLQSILLFSTKNETSRTVVRKYHFVLNFSEWDSDWTSKPEKTARVFNFIWLSGCSLDGLNALTPKQFAKVKSQCLRNESWSATHLNRAERSVKKFRKLIYEAKKKQRKENISVLRIPQDQKCITCSTLLQDTVSGKISIVRIAWQFTNHK